MQAPVTLPSSVRDVVSEEEIAAILLGGRRRPARPSSFTYVAVRHGVASLLVDAGVTELLPAAVAAGLF